MGRTSKCRSVDCLRERSTARLTQTNSGDGEQHGGRLGGPVDVVEDREVVHALAAGEHPPAGVADVQREEDQDRDLEQQFACFEAGEGQDRAGPGFPAPGRRLHPRGSRLRDRARGGAHAATSAASPSRVSK